MVFMPFLILMGFSFNASSTNIIAIEGDLIVLVDGDTLTVSQSPFSSSLKAEDDQKKKKLVCALFAFPFPFGFVGAHRVMLGTKPWIPVVYVATFGGCFGVLPLIDFCVITFSKNAEQYENNPKLFMWMK